MSAAETARSWAEAAVEERGSEAGAVAASLAQTWALVSIAESLERLATSTLLPDFIPVHLVDQDGGPL